MKSKITKRKTTTRKAVKKAPARKLAKKPTTRKPAKKVVKKTTTKKPVVKKTAPKKTVKKVATKKATPKKTVKKAVKKSSHKKEFILQKTGLDKQGHQKLTAVRIYKKKPNGWREIKGATTAPIGCKWIDNGKSIFNGEYKSALVRE